MVTHSPFSNFMFYFLFIYDNLRQQDPFYLLILSPISSQQQLSTSAGSFVHSLNLFIHLHLPFNLLSLLNFSNPCPYFEAQVQTYFPLMLSLTILVIVTCLFFCVRIIHFLKTSKPTMASCCELRSICLSPESTHLLIKRTSHSKETLIK